MQRLVLMILILAGIGATSVAPLISSAAEMYEAYQGTYNAKILEILDEEVRTVGFGDVVSTYRTLQVQLLDGPQEGKIVTFDSDFPGIVAGDSVFLNYLVDITGVEIYSITNIDRRGTIYFFVALFIVAVLIFGGKQGLRSLLALAGSFLAILYVLIPGILNGWNPLWASFLVASGILFAAIFFTHGLNRESTVAYIGTMIAVVCTLVLAKIAVYASRLSGFTDDTTIYLNFNTGGNLDFTGLLLGAIIIGVLGVLDDIAVTQAAVVTELYQANRNLTVREVYHRAIRIGREHVGALVNTLVLAYTGTALPLLLLLKVYEYSVGSIINMEIFATEIIRTVVGSIGLVITVPIVTLFAAVMLRNYTPKHVHAHSHGHSHTHHD